jgi:hypothetical protein
VTVKMGKSSAQVHNVGSLDDLFKGIEKEFDTLQKCCYTIECKEQLLDLRDDSNDNLNFIRNNGKTVKVAQDILGFGDVKLSHIQLNTIFDFASPDSVDIDNSKFPVGTLDLTENLKALLQDLKTRVHNVSTDAGTSEATKRELISPIIIYALAAVNAARTKKDASAPLLLLSDEKWLRGRWCHGPLDFAIRVKDYTILVTEARKSQLDDGILQNLAQHCANQEQKANSSLTAGMNFAMRKRKFSESLSKCRKQKSFGVVTTSTEYLFLQVDGNTVVKSGIFPIQLSRSMIKAEEASFEIQVERVLKAMVGMIQSAVAEAGL